jgi:hypothetical protein
MLMRLLVFILLASACAAPQVKPADVRKAAGDAVKGCEPKGTIDEQIEGDAPGGALSEQAMDAARERAATRGANRIVVTKSEAEEGFVRIQAEVFFCD